jgi:hypothetical protein
MLFLLFTSKRTTFFFVHENVADFFAYVAHFMIVEG